MSEIQPLPITCRDRIAGEVVEARPARCGAGTNRCFRRWGNAADRYLAVASTMSRVADNGCGMSKRSTGRSSPYNQ